MANKQEPRLLKALRLIAGALIALTGAFVLWSGLAGPEPIRLSTGDHQYYQLVANPPQHAVLLGIVGIACGCLLMLLPVLRRKQGR